MRGARGSNDDILIAFSTSSNSDRVALSPFAHLHYDVTLYQNLEKLVIG